MLTKCALCGGEVKSEKVEKVIRVENDVVIVSIDAEVCQRCGEAYYTPKTVEKLQEMRKEMLQKFREI